MKHFYSLSKFPGKTGETNYGTFFSLKDLQYTYTALKCEDIISGMGIVKLVKPNGVSISMPFKTSVIPLLADVDPLVSEFNSCNTIVLIDGEYIGYNTDYYGVLDAVESFPNTEHVSILGNGSIGSMFKKMLGDRATVYSRLLGNWEDRQSITGIVINCTSFGTAVPDSPFQTLPKVSRVIDLAIAPNDLKKQCQTCNIKYVAGIEFYRQQFRKQFELYTGLPLTQEEVDNNI